MRPTTKMFRYVLWATSPTGCSNGSPPGLSRFALGISLQPSPALAMVPVEAVQDLVDLIAPHCGLLGDAGEALFCESRKLSAGLVAVARHEAFSARASGMSETTRLVAEHVIVEVPDKASKNEVVRKPSIIRDLPEPVSKVPANATQIKDVPVAVTRNGSGPGQSV